MTEADESSWRLMLDKLLEEDSQSAVTRIPWKPSRLGGRPWIMPSATATQLGASRRTKGNSNGNGLDKYCADI